MKHFLISLGLLIAASSLAYTQKIDKREITFEYIQLPLLPLDQQVKGYTSQVVMAYEAEILAQKQKAQDDYDREMAEYPSRVAAAEAHHKELMDKYDADMKAWQEKSAMSKLVEKKILEENNKPVQPVYYPPSKPYLKEIRHQKIFNAEMLAGTYLKLDGYTKGGSNPVKIIVTMYGFESLEPVMKTEESSVYDTKTKATTKVVKYSWEFSYKHPMNLRVEGPDGSTILDESFSSLAEFSVFKTAANPSSSINRDEVIRRLEGEVAENNLKFINEFLNGNFGFPRKKNSTILYAVEPKKFQYDEHAQALELANTAYQMLISDNGAASEKLGAAASLWEKAMLESNPADNKARIDKDVSIATLFNLAEAYMWMNEFAKAEQSISKLLAMDPSKKEKSRAEELRTMVKDQKARWDARR